MDKPTNYRVVGLRADSSRRILADGLSEKLAIEIREQVGDGVFARVIIEQYDSMMGQSKEPLKWPRCDQKLVTD